MILLMMKVDEYGTRWTTVVQRLITQTGNYINSIKSLSTLIKQFEHRIFDSLIR